MNPIHTLESRTVVLSNSNIDTDQIIPARFLTTTTKEGLGKHLFEYWRYSADGSANAEFVLNQPAPAVARCSSPATTSVAALRASTRHGRCSTMEFAPS